MSITITTKPDFRRMYGIIREELADGLVKCGRMVILDNTTRIDLGITPDGGPQKENSPWWQAIKSRKRGHTTPLRYNDVLSDPHGYTINDHPAFGSIPLPKDTLKVSVGMTTRGFPPRSDVLVKLRAMGYKYWALTDSASAHCIELLKTSLSTALRRITD